jgi:uncharacterized protein YigE (DUF2233 family)
MVGQFRRAWLMMIAALSTLGGCMNPNGAYTLLPSSSATPIPTLPTLTHTPSTTTWETVAPGLERRSYVPNNRNSAQLYVVRIDPAYYTFRAHYRPGEPLSVEGWQQELPNAVAIINTNFFERDHRILGLLISDQVVYGETLVNRGGTFFVQDGRPAIRSNIYEPYNGELFDQAIQAFPMLVLDGEQAYTDTARDRSTRRTVIAIDSSGRVLLIVTPRIGLTLLDLAAWLAQSDMEIVDALNLDGGGSTMLHLQDVDQRFNTTSFDPVPAVLAVYAR